MLICILNEQQQYIVSSGEVENEEAQQSASDKKMQKEKNIHFVSMCICEPRTNTQSQAHNDFCFYALW